MTNKKIRVRQQQKIDTSINWDTASKNDFVPLLGEIIVYSDLNKIKIGDGINFVNDLPFLMSNSEADASGENATVIGGGTASGADSTVIGSGTASGEGSTVIGSGTASGDYSVAFNNGIAYGDNSTSLGRASAGCLGFYWYSIGADGKTLTLSISQTENTWDDAANEKLAEWAIGDELSYKNETRYVLKSAITGISIDNHTVTVDELPFEEKTDYQGDDYTEFSIINPRKPGAGIIHFAEGAFSAGIENSAAGTASVSLGQNNLSAGEWSYTEGRGNTAIGTCSHAEGNNTVAANGFSHAEGQNTQANGARSHAEGWKTQATGTASHSEGASTEASGMYAHAEGGATHATALRSHAEGHETIASGENSHAEGQESEATGVSAHAEGAHTVASGSYSHAEGVHTAASGSYSHAEGWNTESSGGYSHAEGVHTVASGSCSHAEGYNTESSGGYSHAEGDHTVASGSYSHAEGYNTQALGTASHAEGDTTHATAQRSHAEGYGTISHRSGSHAEGGPLIFIKITGDANTKEYTINTTNAAIKVGHIIQYNNILSTITKYVRNSPISGTSTIEVDITLSKTIALDKAEAIIFGTTATGDYSHAEGYRTIASGNYTHSEGYCAIATGNYSHAEGTNTIAEAYYSHVEGHDSKTVGIASHAQNKSTIAKGYATTAIGAYNNDNSTEPTVFSSTNDAFIIGNGTSATRANAFRVDFSGNVYATNSSMSTGADYAEYFEWADGNPDAEDRIGRFVTLSNGNQIALANIGDENLGVISGHAAILGDAYEDSWNGMYDRDIYGRLQYEEVEVEYEEEDEEGNITTRIAIETHIKRNPNYDPTQTYIPRSKRPEWAPVGLLGKLVVIDDGTCAPSGKCSCGINGTATASTTGYHVLKRLDDTHI